MFKKFFNKYKRYTETQKAIRELQAMSNRDLADIGVRRGDIEWLVKNAEK